jgi:hypothetical protein
MSAAVRPSDRASALILSWQDELTALDLLRDADGNGGRAPLTTRGPVQSCGTEAAARRHRRRHEPLCDACREAENAASRDRGAAARADRPERTRELGRERLRRWRAGQRRTAA